MLSPDDNMLAVGSCLAGFGMRAPSQGQDSERPGEHQELARIGRTVDQPGHAVGGITEPEADHAGHRRRRERPEAQAAYATPQGGRDRP